MNFFIFSGNKKILLTGARQDLTTTDFYAWRYLANDALDTTFGSSGKVITPIGINSDSTRAMVLLPDGKVVAAGMCISAVNQKFCALQYLPSGTFDANFDVGGKVMLACYATTANRSRRD